MKLSTNQYFNFLSMMNTSYFENSFTDKPGYFNTYSINETFGQFRRTIGENLYGESNFDLYIKLRDECKESNEILRSTFLNGRKYTLKTIISNYFEISILRNKPILNKTISDAKWIINDYGNKTMICKGDNYYVISFEN